MITLLAGILLGLAAAVITATAAACIAHHAGYTITRLGHNEPEPPPAAPAELTFPVLQLPPVPDIPALFARRGPR